MVCRRHHRFLHLSAALALRCVHAGTPLFASSSAVRELTPSDFESTVLSGKPAWFVDFYADWCPHCMHFAPIWESVARGFGGDYRVKFGAVDCAVHTSFCGSVQVGAYPTLRSFNLPGVSDSFQKTGAYFHEGEYHVDEQADLIVLLRSKLLSIGPAPDQVGADGSGSRGSGAGGSSVTTYPKPDEPMASMHSATLRLVDAEVALTYALRQGTALAATESSANFFKQHLEDNDLALVGDKLDELVKWLSFLSVVMPSTRARSNVARLALVARKAQAGTGRLIRDDWLKALAAQAIDVVPPEAGDDPAKYWKLCTTYTCGLWTLFHLVTVSSAEISGGGDGRRLLTSSRHLENSPQKAAPEALERIRGFVVHFFGCADCASHFLSMYDGCQFGRCLLSPEDRRGGALWLWQVHNNVTLRVASEQGYPQPERWPPWELCTDCWRGEGQTSSLYDAEEVYAYMVRAYTPASDVEMELPELDLHGAQVIWRKESLASLWSNKGVRLAFFLATAGIFLATLFWWNASRDNTSVIAMAQNNKVPHYLRTEEDNPYLAQARQRQSRPNHLLNPTAVVLTL